MTHTTTRIKTQGTEIRIGDGAGPEVFNKILQVDGFAGLGSGEGSDIEVTDFDSTRKEFVQGLIDEGSLTFTLNYDPQDTYHAQMKTDRDAQTLRNFEIEIPDGTVFSFAAWIKKIDKNAGKDSVLKSTVTLRINDGLTETPGA